MAHLIDRTLTILKDVMSAHKQSLTAQAGQPEPIVWNADAQPRASVALRLLGAIEERSGLDVSALTADRLVRVLAPIALDELEAFVQRMSRLPGDDPHWHDLIEQLTVHETYVMRDPEQLNFFASLLPGLLADAAADRRWRLRVWSVGCSSGEEAYTLAALAHEALLARGAAHADGQRIELEPPWRVEVLGCDISRPVLAVARAGIYQTGPLSSFRGAPPEVLRYFPAHAGSVGTPEPALRSVHPCLRQAVRFERGNILTDPAPAGGFDAVVCRNVLVHFSPRARARALHTLQAAVRPGGYLLLGPTDALAKAAEYECLWAPGAVIQRRRPADA